MEMHDSLILACVIVIAIVFDIRERRIPNLLLLAGLVVGVVNMVLFVEEAHTGERVISLFLGIGILFIPFALRGIGAGDVKLLGLIGFFTGIQGVMNIALISFVVGGIISIACIVWHRIKVYGSFKTVMASVVAGCMTRKFLTNEEGKISLPFSIPLGIGTALVLLCKWGVL